MLQAAPNATVTNLKSTNMNRVSFMLFCGLLFPFIGIAQPEPTLTLKTIQDFKKNHHSVIDIESQKIPYKDSYFVRFKELGKIYNPLFPKTRNKVKVENYWQQGNELSYIGFSFSTFRATVQLKSRVGQFYGLWLGENCSSLIEYQVKRDGDYLKITGKVYKCFSAT